MDGARFDAWTRRRFGRFAGGVLAALRGTAPLAEMDAKRKKRKGRCKRVKAACKPGGKRKCCKQLVCRDKGRGDPDFRCCKPDGEACTSSDECCHACDLRAGSPGRCATE
jgi:hypothetical protein